MKDRDLKGGQTLYFKPFVAADIGLNECIVLCQIDYLLATLPTKEYEGKRWFFRTMREFNRRDFPIWNLQKVHKCITRLQDMGLIEITTGLNHRKNDRTFWYTVNKKNVAAVMARAKAKEDKWRASMEDEDGPSLLDFEKINEGIESGPLPRSMRIDGTEGEETEAQSKAKLRFAQFLDKKEAEKLSGKTISPINKKSTGVSKKLFPVGEQGRSQWGNRGVPSGGTTIQIDSEENQKRVPLTPTFFSKKIGGLKTFSSTSESTKKEASQVKASVSSQPKTTIGKNEPPINHTESETETIKKRARVRQKTTFLSTKLKCPHLGDGEPSQGYRGERHKEGVQQKQSSQPGRNEKKRSRADGTSPRQLGESKRQLGVNPRALAATGGSLRVDIHGSPTQSTKQNRAKGKGSNGQAKQREELTRSSRNVVKAGEIAASPPEWVVKDPSIDSGSLMQIERKDVVQCTEHEQAVVNFVVEVEEFWEKNVEDSGSSDALIRNKRRNICQLYEIFGESRAWFLITQAVLNWNYLREEEKLKLALPVAPGIMAIFAHRAAILNRLDSQQRKKDRESKAIWDAKQREIELRNVKGPDGGLFKLAMGEWGKIRKERENVHSHRL